MDEEREFLRTYDPSAFERPSLAVDVVVLTASAGELHVLLARRADHPFKGWWALPGGFVGIREGLDEAARRVLRTKGGMEQVWLEQLYTFGEPERDPRMRIVSVAYYALVDLARAAPPVDERHWFRVRVPWAGEVGGPVEALGAEGLAAPLAFDHAEMIGAAVKRIRGKLGYTPIGYQLLPETFTLRELQEVHETVLGRSLNKDSFRRRMLASGELAATGEREDAVGHRPAERYRFARRSAI